MGLGISASACGRCHACACVFVCICMRMHMCVGIYICAFFCSECYMHFTGVLGAGVYVTQECFLYQRTHLRTHSLQVVQICVYIYMCVCMQMHIDAYVRL